MKLALGQINPTIGDCAGNARLVLEAAHKAAAAGAEILVLPELTLTGYPPQDLLDLPAFHLEIQSALQTVAAQAPLTTLVGFAETNPSRVGKPFFNSAALIRQGKVEAVYRKQLLPYYGVFDDNRYFESGQQPCVFEQGGVRFGITICEDIWNQEAFNPRLYAKDPLADLAEQNCAWVLNLSASPFELGKPAKRLALGKHIAKKYGFGLALCNQASAVDDLIFDGGSFAIDSRGEVLARAVCFESAVCVSDLKQPSAPAQWPESESAWLADALALGIRDYARKNGASRVCLGLSGGVDSSVVAALAVRALGPQAVHGVLLPTRFTSAASNEDALALAKALGVKAEIFNLDPLFEEAKRTLAAGGSVEGLVAENIQPRLRMAVLMAV
ncbi:NAD(+) synthase, partial [bacterium]|nr:NAD(+) synthase [bacterium]